jgi:hypothetical protein
MIFAALAAMACAMPVQAQVSGAAAEVAREGGAVLQPLQKEGFTAFRRDRSYFGAFFRNDAADRSFWVSGFHGMAAAKAAAHKGCEVVSAGQGHCVLYAVSYPRGGDPNAENEGLGMVAGKALQGRYRDQQTATGYGAFAVSGASQYGMSWNWPDAAEAKASAIANCQAHVAHGMAQLNIEGRRWVRSQGLDECRVIDLYRP